jgi:hypothetical protein
MKSVYHFADRFLSELTSFRIREVLGSDLGLETGCSDSGFLGRP